jgi:DNA polymerase-3 subunit alpha
MRAHHPREYMAALISSVMNTKDRVPFYVNACDEMGIEVLPPDVNSSAVDFAVVEGKIRFGLNAVKNVGETAAQRIVAAREDGPFDSIWDFTERVDPQVVNKRSLESLVKCGALDSTGESRMGMLAVLEQALGYGQKLAQDRLMGQSSLFDGLLDAADDVATRHHPAIPTGEFEKQELLRLEKETLGLYVSEHPLSAVREQLRRKTDATLSELERRRDGEVVTVGGIVSDVKHLTTKRGDPMVFLTLDDPTGTAEVVVFNSAYQASRELCVTDRILIVKGRIDHKQQGETKLLAAEMTAFEAVPERREVRFSLDAREAPAGVIRELARLVREFPGESPVYLSLDTSEGPKTYALGPEYRVRPDPDFIAEARAVLGGSALLS